MLKKVSYCRLLQFSAGQKKAPKPIPKSGASANSATLATVLNHEAIDHGCCLPA
jgi:hypothetical protein